MLRFEANAPISLRPGSLLACVIGLITARVFAIGQYVCSELTSTLLCRPHRTFNGYSVEFRSTHTTPQRDKPTRREKTP